MVSISVIIPIYNKADYVTACVDSVLAQNMRNIEILLIDDGSTDNSLYLCQQRFGELSCVRIFSQSNYGAGAARNFGITQAKGRYIAFIDADDTVSETYLKRMYQQALLNHAEVVHEAAERWMLPTVLPVNRIERLKLLFPGYILTNVVCSLYDTEFIRSHSLNFIDSSFFEDAWFGVRALCEAEIYLLLPGSEYHVMLTPESITRGNIFAKIPQYVDSIMSISRTLSQYLLESQFFSENTYVEGAFFLYFIRLSVQNHFSPLLHKYEIEIVADEMKRCFAKYFESGDTAYITWLLMFEMMVQTQKQQRGYDGGMEVSMGNSSIVRDEEYE